MNKYKKLMNNTLIFGIGQFAAKILGFFLVAIYTRVMAEEEYSTADLIYNTVNVLFPLVTLGMSDAVIRFGMVKENDPRRVFTNAVTSVMAGMTVFMLFTPLVARNSILGEYSFLLYICCYFSCFRQMASQFVRARGYVKLFMVDGIFSTFMQLILNILLLICFKLGVTGYVLSIVISDALSIVFLTLIGSLHKSLDLRFFNKPLLKEMLKFSVPLIPTYLLWWVTSASDRWFVIAYKGSVENGIYVVGYKLPGLLMLVTTMFYQAWQMSSIEERDSRSLNKFYENVFGAYTSFLFIAAAGLIMLVRPLTAILAGNGENTRYFEAAAFTPILITAMIFQCFCQFLSSVYTTKKRSMNSFATATVAAVVNILLNLTLIPDYGVWGAAIATAASYFACFAVRIFDARRYIFFKVDYIRIAVNTVLTIVMCIIAGKQPSLYGLWLVLLFIVSLVLNYKAVLRTLFKILDRRSPKPQNAGAQNGNN